jgi:hypothetical protein
LFAVQHYKEIFGRKGNYDNLDSKLNIPRNEVPVSNIIVKSCVFDGCEKPRVGGIGSKMNYCIEHGNTIISSPLTSPDQEVPKKKFQFGGKEKQKLFIKLLYFCLIFIFHNIFVASIYYFRW